MKLIRYITYFSILLCMVFLGACMDKPLDHVKFPSTTFERADAQMKELSRYKQKPNYSR
jgi:hypothetical protein